MPLARSNLFWVITAPVVFAAGMLTAAPLSSSPASRNCAGRDIGMPRFLAGDEGYARFSSGATEYEFEYPAGWRVSVRPDEPEPSVGLIGPFSEAHTMPVVLMVRRQTKSATMPLAEYVSRELARLSAGGQARLLEKRMTSIGGHPAQRVVLARVWRSPMDLGELLHPSEIISRPVVERYLIIERGDRLYVLTYVAPEELDGRFAEVFERVIGTFRFRSS